jgi:ATP-dependent Lon protease
MTGEIDTHGRITGVGGLDVKLETAISAGCRTVVVPAENLHGPGGIEKFPEALQQELQILSFDEWQGEHEPFDYTHQVLQVVAVDHISQAWEVAIVDEEALATIAEDLQARTQKAAHKLATGRRSTQRHTLAILVKDTDALDPEMFEPPLCQEECGCWLLVQPPAFATVSARLSWLPPQVQLQQFNPQSDDLAQVLRKILHASAPAQDSLELALIAPYFAIRQLVDLQPAGAAAESSDHLPDLPGVRLFANNYTVQGVKLKRSKPLLNRAYYRLLLLGPEALERCPFVSRQGPVHVADLSPIPERFRLDRGRAELLLQQWFEEWLSAMETRS